MRILVNGLPYFSRRLVRDLQAYDPQNTYLFLNTYESFWAKAKFRLLLPFFDKVLSMNGVSDPSGSLDLVLKYKKPLIMLWQGTDVSLALERAATGTIYRKYLDYANHYAVAPWLVDELRTLGIGADELSFIWLSPNPGPLSPAGSFSAMTYLAKGREDFYGWPVIRDAFRQMPDIPLTVVGSAGEGLEPIENITFRGWLNPDEMKRLQYETNVMVRMTQHDGNPHSVAEALGMGMDVIWNYPHPRVLTAGNATALRDAVRELKQKFTDGNSGRNEANIEWVRTHLNRTKVLQNFIDTLKKA